MAKYQVTNGCCYCMECISVCPAGAITMNAEGAKINPEKCKGCGICVNNCASEAITKCD